MRVALYKALQGTVSGQAIERRGLDTADDPHGYLGCPGTSGKAGAYFTTDPALALALAPKRDYRNGVLLEELEQAEYDAICAAGGILPDPYLPRSSVRVQPASFSRFNAATSAPTGSRSYYPPGSLLPGGVRVPP